MTRELKFRAFDKVNLRMMRNVSTGTVDIFDNNQTSHSDDCVFMQYTGLKDSRGVEIYEGDIVKWTDSDGVIRFNVVYYGFCKFFLCNSERSLFEYSVNNLVVIGNMYENPSLLEAKQ